MTNSADAKTTTSTRPAVRYFRAGGFNQLYLKTADDLKALASLEETLWVASSCPTTGLDLDERTLRLMDTDNDGRIRVPEILAAVRWVLSRVKDPSGLPEGHDWLTLEQIVTADAEGALLEESARHVLNNLGRAGETKISLGDVLDRQSIFAVARSAGDGVIPATATDEPAVAAVIENIIATIGGEESARGATGVKAAAVDEFYKALEAYAGWWAGAHPAARAELAGKDAAGEPELDAAIFPLGDQTAAASAAVEAIAAKVEEYFESCELAAFDAQSVSFLNFSDRDLAQLGGRSREEIAELLQKLPLARVQPDQPLPLAEGINPHYASALAALNQAAVAPVLGGEQQTLSLGQWRKLRDTFAAYRAWRDAKAGAQVEPLGLPRIAELLRENRRPALEALLKADEEIAAEMRAVDQVEKLLRYHRDIFRLLNNYVAMPEFYDEHRRAVFQMGRLIIDGCELNLCVDVDDMGRHATIAEKSGIFLVYCELSRKDEAAKKLICAAVTYRGVGRISVGKNAVFYDRYGRDWDALVVKVITNPISLAEAAWAPFKKVGDLIGGQLDKLSASREKAFEDSVNKGLTSASTAGAASAPAPAGGGMGAMGMLAGGGLAIAAVTSAFAFIAQTFQKVNNLQLLYTAIIIILCVMIPSVLIGYLKLRRRDIGMLLEACGWAINGRMRIHLKLARQLMNVGRFSKTSERTYPEYAEKRGGVWRWIFWLWLLCLVVTAGTYAYRTYWVKPAAEEAVVEESVEVPAAETPAGEPAAAAPAAEAPAQ